MSTSDSRNGCTLPIGFGVVLTTVLLIGLKLGGVIDWYWVWVLSPLWGYACGWCGVLGGIFLAALVVASLSERGR